MRPDSIFNEWRKVVEPSRLSWTTFFEFEPEYKRKVAQLSLLCSTTSIQLINSINSIQLINSINSIQLINSINSIWSERQETL